MRTGKDIALVLLTITTLTGAWLAWSQTRELQRLRQTATTSDTTLSSTAANPSTPAPEAASPMALPAARPAAGPAVSAERQAAEDSRRLRQEEMMRVQETPEFQQLRAVQLKGTLDYHYAALFRQLGLPPDKLEALKNLLLERQTVGMDVNTVARAQGLDPRRDGALLQQLMTQARDEINAGIRDLLGEEPYRSYEFYEQTMPYRDVVNQLDLRLSYTSAPLTDAQAEALVKIVVEANQDTVMVNSGATQVVNFRRMQTSLNDTTLDRARGILTPDQYPALEELQARQQANLRMGELMRPAIGRDAVPAVMLPSGGD